MSRYQALRLVGCDWLTAAFIALSNRMAGVPAGQIRFMHMTIDYEDTQ